MKIYLKTYETDKDFAVVFNKNIYIYNLNNNKLNIIKNISIDNEISDVNFSLMQLIYMYHF